MTPTPRIIVACGVWNEAEYLEETIPAILRQSMPDFALYVLDNGSTDDSWALLQDLTCSDPRVTLTRSSVNLWPPVAANRAWPLLMTQYPATDWFLNSGADDMMEAGYLEAILAAADRNPNANCIFAPRAYIGHPERGVQPWPAYDPATVHVEPQIPGWRAITRVLWDTVGPENESIRIGADWEWAVRASAMGVLKPVQLDQPLLSLRVRPPSRASQSTEVDWPRLHRELCGIVGKPVPEWAR